MLLKTWNKRRRLAEYQYRENSHFVWETRRLLILTHSIQVSGSVCVKTVGQVLREGDVLREGGEKVERSCSKINYAKYFPSSEYEIVAASSFYTRRKLNLLFHCKLYSSRKKITSFCLMNISLKQVNCSEATTNTH